MSDPVLSVEEATTEGKKQTVVAGMMFLGFTLSVAILLSGLYFARGYYETVPVSNHTRQTRCFVLSSAISPIVCKSDCNCKINDSDPSDWRFECETCSRKCFETSFKVLLLHQSSLFSFPVLVAYVTTVY
jgi:hypothetical protein